MVDGKKLREKKWKTERDDEEINIHMLDVFIRGEQNKVLRIFISRYIHAREISFRYKLDGIIRRA